MVIEEKWITKFWSKVDKTSDSNGCWLWLGGKHSQGYGMYTYYPNNTQKTHTAHRFSAIVNNLDMTAGPLLRHKCHNPICCNPSHLESGTQRDNMHDMIKAGRQKSRRRHFNTEFINNLKEEYKNGATQLELSKKYNITSSHMSILLNRPTK